MSEGKKGSFQRTVNANKSKKRQCHFLWVLGRLRNWASLESPLLARKATLQQGKHLHYVYANCKLDNSESRTEQKRYMKKASRKKRTPEGNTVTSPLKRFACDSSTTLRP